MISSVSRSLARSVRNGKRGIPSIVPGSRRGFVQPTRTERASVVDTPPSADLENKFTPRAGKIVDRALELKLMRPLDMLGFKLEVPAKVQGTERPIYLDMQVWIANESPFQSNSDLCVHRPLPPSIHEYWTQCFPITPTSMGILTVVPTRTDGKLRLLWTKHGR
jgi:hypothetical protein